MENSPLTEQTLALAAALQALGNVCEIAQRGMAPREDTAACLRGLLHSYSGDLAQLYGGTAALERGLHLLVQRFSQPADGMLTRYLVTMLYLERKLNKDRAMLARLADGLQLARRQAEYFDASHENVIRNLAGLYTETISTLRPRLMIQGNRAYLEQSGNAELIRAQLLAAMRAVSFWRQAGGSRWRLLFQRRQLVSCAKRKLASI